MTRPLARLALAASALMLGIAGANANVLVTIEQDGFGSGPIKWFRKTEKNGPRSSTAT